MKERPILFSGPMVRALLDGRKTQTRRIVKLPHNNPLGQWEPIPIGGENGGRTAAGETIPLQGGIWHTRTGDSLMCPHGQPGDRLWVRETWRGVVEINPPGKMTELGVARYVPDQQYCRRVEYLATHGRDDEPWRPNIHMPRWASRITLEVTGVRVESLEDISEADARAEGVTIEERHMNGYCAGETRPPSIRAFRELWESINGAGAWTANPWVWVVQFKRVTREA
ncbi:hypothetical protein AAGS40_23425 [Paraburkholderia sp. PREW-6R]|uniref:hypothetical protein n=1 Tax=Paraburkholderia sp. PREW-6R TaxID=3141544 RepID=UPI0031F5764F